MTTRRSLRTLAIRTFLPLLATGSALAQGFERDVTVTGPRGNSVSRSFSQQRVGPWVDRSVTVTGPRGNSITRNTEIFAPRGGYGPRGFVGGGGPVIVGGPPVVGVGLGVVPAFNLFVGGGGVAPLGPPVPPPPTYYQPPIPYPASTAAAQAAAAGTPPPHQPSPPPPGARVVDPVAENVSKLSSLHSNTRREGSITLGQYGDARAVPALIDRLQHDHEKEVRMAAAWALAEIGDPRGVVPLETARQFDKRADVRAVAEKSLGRISRPPVEPTPMHVRAQPSTAQAARRWQANSSAVESMPSRTASPAPTQGGALDDLPPPDPTPVVRSPR